MLSEFVARRGLKIFIYYSIAIIRANQGIVSATKTLLAPSVSSSGYVFSTRIFKQESSCQQ